MAQSKMTQPLLAIYGSNDQKSTKKIISFGSESFNYTKKTMIETLSELTIKEIKERNANYIKWITRIEEKLIGLGVVPANETLMNDSRLKAIKHVRYPTEKKLAGLEKGSNHWTSYRYNHNKDKKFFLLKDWNWETLEYVNEKTAIKDQWELKRLKQEENKSSDELIDVTQKYIEWKKYQLLNLRFFLMSYVYKITDLDETDFSTYIGKKQFSDQDIEGLFTYNLITDTNYFMDQNNDEKKLKEAINYLNNYKEEIANSNNDSVNNIGNSNENNPFDNSFEDDISFEDGISFEDDISFEDLINSQNFTRRVENTYIEINNEIQPIFDSNGNLINREEYKNYLEEVQRLLEEKKQELRREYQKYFSGQSSKRARFSVFDISYQNYNSIYNFWEL